jgi:hypothetical protein
MMDNRTGNLRTAETVEALKKLIPEGHRGPTFEVGQTFLLGTVPVVIAELHPNRIVLDIDQGEIKRREMAKEQKRLMDAIRADAQEPFRNRGRHGP